MFLPISDDNPHGKFPVVNYLLIISCIVVFVWEVSLPTHQALEAAIYKFGVVPSDLIKTQPFVMPRPFEMLTIFTSMFMHGGWMHLLGNMLFLWIFGDNIEASMGSFRYLIFYLLCGVAAALTQSFSAPDSIIPMIGASGAISGILGAYFVLHPLANVRVLVWFIIFVTVWHIPAFLVLGFWFAAQFISSRQVDPGEPGIAFMAHIGGFVAGAVLVWFFKKKTVHAFAPAESRAFSVEKRRIHKPQM